jgi:hypothetical protein
MSMAEGVDVSEHQGAIDASWWAQWDFAIIRAHSGYRADHRWPANWAAARSTLRGCYGYMVVDRDPAWQAHQLLRLTAGDPPELGWWCDAEEPGLTVENVLAYMGTLEAAGARCGLYASASFLAGPLRSDRRLARWPLWLAAWGPNDGRRHPPPPTPWPWSIHQYTSRGGPGGSPLDRNYADDHELRRLTQEPPEMRSMALHKPGEHQLWLYDPASGTKTRIASAAAWDGMRYLASVTGLNVDGPHNGAYEADPAFIDALPEIPATPAGLDLDQLAEMILDRAGQRLST